MKGKKTLLTEEGLKELQDELDELINVKRPANIQALKEARALGRHFWLPGISQEMQTMMLQKMIKLS